MGDRIVIHVATLPFSNKTFGYRIDGREKDGNPKERTPDQRSNQICTEIESEVADECRAE